MNRKWIGLAALAAALIVLGAKGIQQGWFAPRPPLELGGRPALLFFNNDRGCECVLVVYQRADAQIANWSPADRGDVPLHRINLEQRPDMARQHHIVRAPTLLLLDGEGKEIWRQDEITSDWRIFDLERFEEEILVLLGDSL